RSAHRIGRSSRRTSSCSIPTSAMRNSNPQAPSGSNSSSTSSTVRTSRACATRMCSPASTTNTSRRSADSTSSSTIRCCRSPISERTPYREKLAENLELFDTYLRHAEFKSAGTSGLELELNLVDGENQPSLRNKDVLARLDDEYQSEIGGFNLELNHPVLQVA